MPEKENSSSINLTKNLYITVFTTGMTTLALEFSASRLLGNYFGTSNLVWASIIGLILIYLTAGYFLGGYWADRSPKYTTFYKILLWGGFTSGLVPVLSRPVLRLSAEAFDQLQMGVLAGSFISVLILFSIPVTLLGTASPFAIRLAMHNTRTAGSISGKIYAISTLGSFIGTFLPTLILTPAIGTFRTFLVFSLLVLLVAAFFLYKFSGIKAVLPYLVMPVIIIILLFTGFGGTDKVTPGLIYETESSYNYIQVLQEGDYRLLRLNDGQGVHSVYHPNEMIFYGPWEQVLAAPFFNQPPYEPAQVTSMAIVGLAAGTTARQAAAAFPNIQIDGIEIDPKIIQIGQKFFDLNLPNLHIIIQDGRWALERSNRTYQIISLDAYRPPYIPPHLTTREFFIEVRHHLTDDGVMVINIGRSPRDRRLINAIYATIKDIFPSIYVMEIPNTFNSILYATVKPTQSVFLMENFISLKTKDDISPVVLYAVETALNNLKKSPDPGIIFTDDNAPVEWITNSLIIDYIFSGGMEELK
jgi:spermidine synthase